MVAIVGVFLQDSLTGSAWGDWARHAGSPLGAFENVPGVQAPVGFRGPLGFTADGDVAFSKRRRETELEHGRRCMLVAVRRLVLKYVRWRGPISHRWGFTVHACSLYHLGHASHRCSLLWSGDDE